MPRLSTDEEVPEGRREEIDPIFKEVLSFRFRQLGIPLQTEVEVSRIPRSIDAVVVLERESDVQRAKTQSPFEHLRRENVIEFKGIRDPLTISGYYLIVGRAYLYIAENDLTPDQVTVRSLRRS